jgi:hypothetical protein
MAPSTGRAKSHLGTELDQSAGSGEPLEHPPDSRESIRSERKSQTRFQQAKYIAINIFVAFHLAAIVFWCAPIDSPLLPLGRNLVRPYFLWAGLFQSWDMFAPLPKSANAYIEAELIYRDGSRKTWSFPRMEQMGVTEKYFRERYRKFMDNLPRDENDPLLVDAARRIARLNSSPNHPVKTVILIHKWSFIVPRTDTPYVPEPWQQHILLGYGVQPGDVE